MTSCGGGVCDVRGLRGVRDPRICFLLPECHMKLVNVAGNKLCLLLTSCGGRGGG